MNEITMLADKLLDAVSLFHYSVKIGKPTGDTLEDIRAIQSRTRKLELLIEKDLAARGYHE